jgi:hypothetical protein
VQDETDEFSGAEGAWRVRIRDFALPHPRFCIVFVFAVVLVFTILIFFHVLFFLL